MVKIKGFGILESIFLIAIAGTAFVLISKQLYQKNEQTYLENMVQDIKKIHSAAKGYANQRLGDFSNGVNQIGVDDLLTDGFLPSSSDLESKYGSITINITANMANKTISGVVVNMPEPKNLNNALLRQDYRNYVLNKSGGSSVVNFQ